MGGDQPLPQGGALWTWKRSLSPSSASAMSRWPTCWLAGRCASAGPAPVLVDSEVLTIEVVGAFLGVDQGLVLVDPFRRSHTDLFPFPSLRRVQRTTFTRQAANL